MSRDLFKTKVVKILFLREVYNITVELLKVFNEILLHKKVTLSLLYRIKKPSSRVTFTL
jgi:hypothetical protein